MARNLWWLLLLVLGCSSCHLQPTEHPWQISRWREDELDRVVTALRDDIFAVALNRQLALWQQQPPGDSLPQPWAGCRSEWVSFTQAIAQQRLQTPEVLRAWLQANAVLMAPATPLDKPLTTGYFLPTLPASRQASRDFSYPIYQPPDDRITVKLSDFGVDAAGATDLVGVLDGKRLKPYPTREAIDQQDVLRGKAKVLAYLASAIDAFILHVQGSGVLTFPDGTSQVVGFAGHNGYPYKSLGKLMVADGDLDLRASSMPAIVDFFHQHPERWPYYAAQMPRYIFFAPHPGAIGTPGVELTPLHSIAVDSRYFPYGALLLLDSALPHPEQDTVQPDEPFFAAVLAQDSGGAIKRDHVDLYFGAGDIAWQRAGHMKRRSQAMAVLPANCSPPSEPGH